MFKAIGSFLSRNRIALLSGTGLTLATIGAVCLYNSQSAEPTDPEGIANAAELDDASSTGPIVVDAHVETLGDEAVN
jgi:hypothetical protein